MDGDGGEGQEDEGGEEVGSASEVESEENAGQDGVVEGVLGVGAVEEGVEVFEGGYQGCEDGEWEVDEG